MIPMTLGRIAEALGSSCPEGAARKTVHRVSTDSRAIAPGDLFVAVRGERYDGHEFVSQAANDGAAACIRQAGNPVKLEIPCIEVQDTVQALGQLARYYRRSVMPSRTRFVAVTGSNGKTTTKRMIDHVLSPSFSGHCSQTSFNNSIGVPLTILSGGAGDSYVIVEVGTNSPGEVALLAEIAAPDVGVITSIGEAHLEGLGDLNAIAAEKASLLNYVRPGGIAIVSADSPPLMRCLSRHDRLRMVSFGLARAADLRVTGSKTTLLRTTCDLGGRYRLELPFPGLHHACNAAAAFAVGEWFGLEASEILSRLGSFQPPEGRTRPMKIGGVAVVDDTYNANPTSMRAAIETLSQISSNGRILVMGDMLELGAAGERMHDRVLAEAVDAGIDLIVTVGPMFAETVGSNERSARNSSIICCRSADEAGDVVISRSAPGDTLWVKGSRAIGLDLVIDRLRKADREKASSTFGRPGLAEVC